MEAHEIRRLGGMLGLCMRARKLLYGTDMVTEGIRKSALKTKSGAGKREAPTGLVLLSCDASGNTAKRITNSCHHYGVRLLEIPMDKSELSACMGRMAETAVVGVFDGDFVKALWPMLRGCREIEAIGDREGTTMETKNAQREASCAGGNEYDQ